MRPARTGRGRADLDRVRGVGGEEATEDDHEQDDQTDAESDAPLGRLQDGADRRRRPLFFLKGLRRDQIGCRRRRHLATAALRRGFRYAAMMSAATLTMTNSVPIIIAIASTL